MKTLVRGIKPEEVGFGYGNKADRVKRGKEIADWLNGLGEDEEQYGGTRKTCGEVRKSWLDNEYSIRRVDWNEAQTQ